MFWAFQSHTHFWWNPFSKTHFLCIKMASSSKESSFLAFHGKIYDPIFEWHNDDGLLQDPITHAPYCHEDTKVSFSLVSLLGKMLLHVLLKVSWWDIVIFEILRHCVIDHVWKFWLWSILEVLLFLWSWCNLDNVGGFWNFDNVGKLWCCWMKFGLC